MRVPSVSLINLSRHVLQAANNPVEMDDRQVNAVAARIELDLRIGAAFTRLQTLQLQKMSEKLEGQTISYGEVKRASRNSN